MSFALCSGFVHRCVTCALLNLIVPNCLAQMADRRNLAVGVANPALSEKRVALVIGNSAYANSALRNPINDAADMASRLRSLGFEVVLRNNLITRQVGGTLREFRSKLSPGAVALVFYAAHGVQIKGENYLPTVDADINSEEDVPNQSIAMRQIMDVLDDAKTRLNLIFLDACRNNPYARSFRSSDRGLARISAPSGTLISYATRPGSVAADGAGRNGLYTGELLKQMQQTQAPIEQVLKRVVSSVKSGSQGKQEPWMEGSIEGDFCFAVCAQGAQTASGSPGPLPSPLRMRSAAEIEQESWDGIKDSRSVEALEQHWKEYLGSWFGSQARVLMAKLKAEARNAAHAPATPASSTSTSPDLAVGRVFKDCEDCPEMVIVPAGSFEMGRNNGRGDEKPVHTVRIQSFAMGATEVTEALWLAVMGNKPPGLFPSSCSGECPIDWVSWDNAQEYIRRINAKTGKSYRLPSEAEWEYACRAGGRHEYCGSDDLNSVAWYGALSEPVGNSQKRPIQSSASSPMLGGCLA